MIDGFEFATTRDMLEWMRLTAERQDNLQAQINLVSSACDAIRAACTLIEKRVKALEKRARSGL